MLVDVNEVNLVTHLFETLYKAGLVPVGVVATHLREHGGRHIDISWRHRSW